LAQLNQVRGHRIGDIFRRLWTLRGNINIKNIRPTPDSLGPGRVVEF
jgi:hypothetical protein